MDNLTHSLVGLALAKSGLERLSPYATAVCVLAANAPDADVVTGFWGRWFALEHHRGITHSIVGVIAIGFLLPLIFYLVDKAVAKRKEREPRVKLKGLLIAGLIATISHPILDWTNNYGVRPFLPFNEQWFYGDLVSIIDPFLWLALGGAGFLLTANTKKKIVLWAVIGTLTTLLVIVFASMRRGVSLPFAVKVIWITGIITIIVLYRWDSAEKWGRKIALAALAFTVLYWGCLSFIHSIAVRKIENEARNIVAPNGEIVTRVAAMPTTAHPFRWYGVAETDKAVYRFESFVTREKQEDKVVRYEKPSGENTAIIERAKQDYGAKSFLRFARFPVVKVDGDCLSNLLVQFADLRYTEPSRQSSGNFMVNVPVECETQSEKNR